jgi:phage terminase large subunit-like protein
MSSAELLALESACSPKDSSSKASQLQSLSDAQCLAIVYDWAFWGRPDQQMPPGDWFIWLIMTGRGWGKTRTATENISRMLRGPSPLVAPPGAPSLMSFVADTAFDMRQYSVEGPSGFLNVGPPDHRPRYRGAPINTLTWPNGAKALLFSAEDPEVTRGASGSFFWWDELAKARRAEDGWTNMLFGMREGSPRGIVTTTPRPVPLIKRLINSPSTHLTVGSTWANRANLAPVYYREVIEPLIGTRTGRQEIDAELLEDLPGALWTRSMIDDARKPVKLPDMQRIVVAVDPSGARGMSERASSHIGIVVAGRGGDGRGYVLADRSCKLPPGGWARRAIDAYHEFQADRVLAERNFGGAMVENTIKMAQRSDEWVSYEEVVASRGKVQRAEPVAALYERNLVSHAPKEGDDLTQLEDQMCMMATDGFMGDGSPDRVDALVWAMSSLLVSGSTYDHSMSWVS